MTTRFIFGTFQAYRCSYRNNPYSHFYNLGIFSMIFSVCYRFRDVEWGSKRRMTHIELFGKYSFSLFVYSTFFDLIPLRLAIIPFFALFFSIEIGLILIIQLWNNKIGGIGSLEWLERKYLVVVDLLESKIKVIRVKN